MKIIRIAAILLVSTLSAAHCSSADSLARQIIAPKTVQGFYVPHIGESQEDIKIKQAIVESPKYLQKYMLSDKATEKLRIGYALSILAQETKNVSDNEAKRLRQEQRILGARLSELN